MTDPTARLLRTTRRRLFVVTLGLIALLVIGIGAATAFVGLRALDADVDRALAASVDAAVAALDGELPQAQEETESDETVPASADTFLLYLDPNGAMVANPSRVALTGLPDASAAAAAAASGRDLRTVDAGGVEVRLLTVPVVDVDGRSAGRLRPGRLRPDAPRRQSNSLVAAIALVAVVGLLGGGGRHADRHRRCADPDPAIVRRPAPVRGRCLARAADADRPHPGQRRGARARGSRRRRRPSPRDRHRRRVGPPVTPRRRSAPARRVRLDRPGPGAPAGRPGGHRDRYGRARPRRSRPSAGWPCGRSSPDAGGVTLVSGDRDRLIQLLLILLDNAFDHSPGAGDRHGRCPVVRPDASS